MSQLSDPNPSEDRLQSSDQSGPPDVAENSGHQLFVELEVDSDCFSAAERREAAISYLRLALAAVEKKGGETGSELVLLLAQLGELESEAGEIEAALAHFCRGIEICRQQGSLFLSESMSCFLNVSVILHFSGNAGAAIDLLIEWVDAAAEGEQADHFDYAVAARQLANFLLERGNYKSAEYYARSAVKAAAKDSLTADEALGNLLLGRALLHQGCNSEAEAILADATNVLYEIGEERLRQPLVDGLAARSSIAAAEKKFPKAEVLLSRAEIIAAGYCLPDDPELLLLKLNRGRIAMLREQWSIARGFYSELLPELEQAYGSNHRLVIEPFSDMGTVALTVGSILTEVAGELRSKYEAVSNNILPNGLFEIMHGKGVLDDFLAAIDHDDPEVDFDKTIMRLAWYAADLYREAAAYLDKALVAAEFNFGREFPDFARLSKLKAVVVRYLQID